MKIVFLCGSLEIGKDGVGDYIRLLSAELDKSGIDVSAVAMYDKFVNRKITEVQRYGENSSLDVLRLPLNISTAIRFKEIEKYVKEQSPEWVSLQYVPYSFNAKGLPYLLPGLLKQIVVQRKLHIMFHELWIGMDLESSFKNRILGNVQKQIVKAIVKQLNPAVITTSIPLYKAELGKMGISVSILKLFGNIPINMTGLDSEKKVNKVSLVIFGGIHYGAPVEELVEDVVSYANQHHNDVLLTFVGRCGSEQERWANTWAAAGLPVEVLGEQSETVISSTLSAATIGITTTPIQLVGKSGTVAAMLEHGLPVICISRKWHSRSKLPLEVAEGVIEYTKGSFYSIVAAKGNVCPSIGLSYTVNNLLDKLKI